MLCACWLNSLLSPFKGPVCHENPVIYVFHAKFMEIQSPGITGDERKGFWWQVLEPSEDDEIGRLQRKQLLLEILIQETMKAYRDKCAEDENTCDVQLGLHTSDQVGPGNTETLYEQQILVDAALAEDLHNEPNTDMDDSERQHGLDLHFEPNPDSSTPGKPRMLLQGCQDQSVPIDATLQVQQEGIRGSSSTEVKKLHRADMSITGQSHGLHEDGCIDLTTESPIPFRKAPLAAQGIDQSTVPAIPAVEATSQQTHSIGKRWPTTSASDAFKQPHSRHESQPVHDSVPNFILYPADDSNQQFQESSQGHLQQHALANVEQGQEQPDAAGLHSRCRLKRAELQEEHMQEPSDHVNKPNSALQAKCNQPEQALNVGHGGDAQQRCLNSHRRPMISMVHLPGRAWKTACSPCGGLVAVAAHVAAASPPTGVDAQSVGAGTAGNDVHNEYELLVYSTQTALEHPVHAGQLQQQQELVQHPCGPLRVSGSCKCLNPASLASGFAIVDPWSHNLDAVHGNRDILHPESVPSQHMGQQPSQGCVHKPGHQKSSHASNASGQHVSKPLQQPPSTHPCRTPVVILGCALATPSVRNNVGQGQVRVLQWCPHASHTDQDVTAQHATVTHATAATDQCTGLPGGPQGAVQHRHGRDEQHGGQPQKGSWKLACLLETIAPMYSVLATADGSSVMAAGQAGAAAMWDINFTGLALPDEQQPRLDSISQGVSATQYSQGSTALAQITGCYRLPPARLQQGSFPDITCLRCVQSQSHLVIGTSGDGAIAVWDTMRRQCLMATHIQQNQPLTARAGLPCTRGFNLHPVAVDMLSELRRRRHAAAAAAHAESNPDGKSKQTDQPATHQHGQHQLGVQSATPGLKASGSAGVAVTGGHTPAAAAVASVVAIHPNLRVSGQAVRNGMPSATICPTSGKATMAANRARIGRVSGNAVQFQQSQPPANAHLSDVADDNLPQQQSAKAQAASASGRLVPSTCAKMSRAAATPLVCFPVNGPCNTDTVYSTGLGRYTHAAVTAAGYSGGVPWTGGWTPYATLATTATRTRMTDEREKSAIRGGVAIQLQHELLTPACPLVMLSCQPRTSATAAASEAGVCVEHGGQHDTGTTGDKAAATVEKQSVLPGHDKQYMSCTQLVVMTTDTHNKAQGPCIPGHIAAYDACLARVLLVDREYKITLWDVVQGRKIWSLRPAHTLVTGGQARNKNDTYGSDDVDQETSVCVAFINPVCAAVSFCDKLLLVTWTDSS